MTNEKSATSQPDVTKLTMQEFVKYLRRYKRYSICKHSDGLFVPQPLEVLLEEYLSGTNAPEGHYFDNEDSATTRRPGIN